MNLQLFCNDCMDFEDYLNVFSENIEQESAELSSIYNDFSIESECENPNFVNMLACGISVRSAYEALHNDRLRDHSEREVQKKISEKLKFNRMRPAENGAGPSGSCTIKNTASDLTAKDREEIARRAMKGEKVIF